MPLHIANPLAFQVAGVGEKEGGSLLPTSAAFQTAVEGHVMIVLSHQGTT